MEAFGSIHELSVSHLDHYCKQHFIISCGQLTAASISNMYLVCSLPLGKVHAQQHCLHLQISRICLLYSFPLVFQFSFPALLRMMLGRIYKEVHVLWMLSYSNISNRESTISHHTSSRSVSAWSLAKRGICSPWSFPMPTPGQTIKIT